MTLPAKFYQFEAAPRPGVAENFGNLQRLMDTAILAATGYAAYFLREGEVQLPDPYWAAILLGVFAHQFIGGGLGCYRWRVSDDVGDQIGKALVALCTVFAALAVIGYLAKISAELSRIWGVVWFVSAALGLSGARLFIAARLRRSIQSGQLASRIVVVAESDHDLAGLNLNADPNGANVAAIWNLHPGADGQSKASTATASSLIFLSSFESLKTYAVAKGVDEIILLGDLSRMGGAAFLSALLRAVPARVRLCLAQDLSDIPIQGQPRVFGLPALTLIDAPIHGTNRLIKDATDIVLGLPLLALALPIMAVAAMAIRMESAGPIIYSQPRRGFRGNVFNVLKLRTMYVEKASDDLRDPALLATKPSDHRVTKVGRFLRRYSIDELPQLINVMRRDMSLVGPRPHALAQDDQLSRLLSDYAVRQQFLPGMTGLAQISGHRGFMKDQAAIEGRIKCDLHYIENWSLWLDLRILFATLMMIWRDDSAY
jgi:putative colanic acid biosynthesis UDP-glucose lipid carrier transferase